MSIAEIKMVLIDNGGRRLGIDSREFSYTNHVPNRERSGIVEAVSTEEVV